ncbi:MAG: YifB family Mg chelatase-like AAA ATPase [Treponema sp.]|uniref:YifB family Mg chelatase-like AAA ATPase n=1 Tax=Treponema sp. TaxID=166 RepID=UPI0025D2B442|nr:YifB family Mg chelatase-like AAA ATPase [Treponema sp.]MBQ8679318.1 YifB family Mg chelatase-like AAA ATPase [Treponema sp.]
MTIFSFSPFGYEGSLVTVEVDLRRGIPAIDIVGLADNAVKESRERMRSAIRNSGFDFPMERVLISLSPADLKKEGAGFDLALALAVLAAQDEKKDFDKEPVLVMGELELSGTIRPVKAVHAAASTAFQAGITKCVVAASNAAEAREVAGMKVFGAMNLTEAYDALLKPDLFTSLTDDTTQAFVPKDCVEVKGVLFPPETVGINFSDILHQKNLIRALQIAAAGGHNLLAFGAPGCGKTLALSRFSELLPLLTVEEAQSITRIHSIAGLLSPSQPLMRIPPFRMPHQSATLEGVCGGGVNCRPGEISLAHNGVLFLDEAAEFRTSVLQMLRVPIETGAISISRAGRTTIYPARFQLLLATNPCPCGNYSSKSRVCMCSAKAVTQYWKKFSAPLLDRIDIRVNVENEAQEAALAENVHPCEACTEQENCQDCGKIKRYIDKSDKERVTTAELRKEIAVATAIQRKRQGKKNACLSPQEILDFCKLGRDEQTILDTAIFNNDFSQRAVSSILKLSRTIADMSGSEQIKTVHLLEAILLRKSSGAMAEFGEGD